MGIKGPHGDHPHSDAVARRTESPERLSTLVGIAGGSGSGKTTIAWSLAAAFGKDECSIVVQDDYYRDLSHLDHPARASVNFDHPDAIEWALMRNGLLALKQGLPVAVPRYDFRSHTRIGEVALQPRSLVIVEGHLLLAVACVRELLDFAVFLHAPEAMLLKRRLSRDVVERGRSADSVLEQFDTKVLPMHREHVLSSRSFADIILDAQHSVEENTGKLQQAIEERLGATLNFERTRGPQGEDR